ncbi:pyridoxal phosphate-dependent aminotransferase [Gemmatimonas sp.]|uniref:pyridoxal phosphate-dependent aminotransferase n=1 Tax=Gemmatimonas sp. TaxID=1962908 RepID=UPI0027B96143|nr:aminotransferase class I/II-fold pyridoxal phosphate-dependent enzyme [Gemmatimonas sp.]
MLPQLLPTRRDFAGDDLIFTLNARAQKRAAEGVPVINATIGALYDDAGKLVVLDTVMEQWQQLSSAEVAPYAPIGGDQTYLLHLVQRHWPTLTSIGVGVAAPGGSGALALTLKNFLDRGDTVLTAAPYWGPYSTLAAEVGMTLATVPYPDVQTGIDIGAWEAACRDILEAQGRLLVWLNDPCHNPTGRSFTKADRAALMDVLRDVSSQGPVTFVLDLAYLDYARDPQQVREALDDYAAFAQEGHVLVGACLSLSKAYTLYGARAGALVFPWTTDSALHGALITSCRGTWSNCARSPMSVLNRIAKDPALQAKLEAEHAHWRTLLATRATALDAALRAQGLAGCAYDGGFFVTLDGGADPDATCETMQAHDVFVIPLPEGLRVGICAMREADVSKFAAAYKASL